MPVPPQDPLELVSEAFDSGCVEQTPIDGLNREFAESTIHSWTELRGTLQDLPVSSAGICQSVMQQIPDNQPVAASDDQNSSVSGRNRLAAALASIAALVVACVSISRHIDTPMSVSELSYTTSPAQIRNALRAPHQDWHVVVVNVPEERHAAIRTKIRDSVVNRGFAVESLVLASENESMTLDSPDIFISSAEAAEEMLEAIETEIHDSEGILSTAPSDEFDRDELLLRFRESMESPTQSDRYFGEMLVVLPDTESVVVSKEQIFEAVAENNETEISSDADSTGKIVANSTGDDAQPENSVAQKRPVLLVLVRKKPEVPGPQSEKSSSSAPNSDALAIITG